MESLLDSFKPIAEQYLVPLALRIAGALVLWVVGARVIGLLVRGAARLMRVRELDPTLTRYAESFIRYALYVLLGIAALGVLGVATTSFAALLAAVGVAIGMAWSGLLANFAAGVFLVVLRPFRVGDLISAGGAVGTVREIGLFACTLDTVDNLRVQIGNNRLLSENIINYSSNATRRCEVKLQLAPYAPVEAVLDTLVELVRALPGELDKPPPQALVLELNAAGPVVAVRFYCKSGDYNVLQAEAFRVVAVRADREKWLAAAAQPAPAAPAPARDRSRDEAVEASR